LSQPTLHSAMQDSAKGASSGRGGRRLRNALVVAEIAFSVMLATGAGLTIRGFSRLLRVDPGFHTDHILTMRMQLPGITYPAGPAVPRFYQQVLEKVRAIPGVQSA